MCSLGELGKTGIVKVSDFLKTIDASPIIIFKTRFLDAFSSSSSIFSTVGNSSEDLSNVPGLAGEGARVLARSMACCLPDSKSSSEEAFDILTIMAVRKSKFYEGSRDVLLRQIPSCHRERCPKRTSRSIGSTLRHRLIG